ncbi:hypothetical protein BS47DRAFT_868318 [Hydnum rufescens UP504]|uniref:Uncharacterized protein n=1 Tax=Hydnum rufescens UP504 TaxID=1448309 RepID=A0A9P6ACM8_9AGAM|nr:hypothetical protein BS47DRAFT_868318 [Hydnum rufescens UP504]
MTNEWDSEDEEWTKGIRHEVKVIINRHQREKEREEEFMNATYIRPPGESGGRGRVTLDDLRRDASPNGRIGTAPPMPTTALISLVGIEGSIFLIGVVGSGVKTFRGIYSTERLPRPPREPREPV